MRRQRMPHVASELDAPPPSVLDLRSRRRGQRIHSYADRRPQAAEPMSAKTSAPLRRCRSSAGPRDGSLQAPLSAHSLRSFEGVVDAHRPASSGESCMPPIVEPPMATVTSSQLTRMPYVRVTPSGLACQPQGDRLPPDTTAPRLRKRDGALLLVSQDWRAISRSRSAAVMMSVAISSSALASAKMSTPMLGA